MASVSSWIDIDGVSVAHENAPPQRETIDQGTSTLPYPPQPALPVSVNPDMARDPLYAQSRPDSSQSSAPVHHPTPALAVPTERVEFTPPDKVNAENLKNAQTVADVEGVLEVVWKDSDSYRNQPGEGSTREGTIEGLSHEYVVLKVADVVQSMLVVMGWEHSSKKDSKKAAADVLAWVCGDASCARNLKRLEIAETVMSLVWEKELEMSWAALRSMRNLTKQSYEYAEIFTSLEGFASMFEMLKPPREDADTTIYLAETVENIARHAKSHKTPAGNALFKTVFDVTAMPLIAVLDNDLHPEAVTAAFSAINALMCPVLVEIFSKNRDSMRSLCATVLYEDQSIREASVQLLYSLADADDAGIYSGVLAVEGVQHLFQAARLGTTKLDMQMLKILQAVQAFNPEAFVKEVDVEELAKMSLILTSGEWDQQVCVLTLIIGLLKAHCEIRGFGSDGVKIIPTVVGLLGHEDVGIIDCCLEVLDLMNGRKEHQEGMTWEMIQAGVLSKIKPLIKSGDFAKRHELYSLLQCSANDEIGRDNPVLDEVIPILVSRLNEPDMDRLVVPTLHALLQVDERHVEIAVQEGIVPFLRDALMDYSMDDHVMDWLAKLVELLSCVLELSKGVNTVKLESPNLAGRLLDFADVGDESFVGVLMHCIRLLVKESDAPQQDLSSVRALTVLTGMLDRGDAIEVPVLRVFQSIVQWFTADVLDSSGVSQAVCKLVPKCLHDAELAVLVLDVLGRIGTVYPRIVARAILAPPNVADHVWDLSTSVLSDLCVESREASVSVLKECRKLEMSGQIEVARTPYVQSLEQTLKKKDEVIKQLGEEISALSDEIAKLTLANEVMQVGQDPGGPSAGYGVDPDNASFDGCEQVNGWSPECDKLRSEVQSLKNALNDQQEHLKVMSEEKDRHLRDVGLLMEHIDQQHNRIELLQAVFNGAERRPRFQF